jgi:alpha-L-fucosidase
VGRGAHFLLNVPPNRDGLIDAADAASLKAYGEYVRGTFDKPVAQASAKELAKPEIVVDVPHEATFNIIRIKEDIRLGQRVEAVTVETMGSDAWTPLASTTSIGPRRIIRLDKPVSGRKIRLNVTKSAAPAVISEFALFHEA